MISKDLSVGFVDDREFSKGPKPRPSLSWIQSSLESSIIDYITFDVTFVKPSVLPFFKLRPVHFNLQDHLWVHL